MSAPRKLDVFPAFHKVEGRSVIIVGGGTEAAAKVRLVAETSAHILVFAEVLDKETGADLIAAGGAWQGQWPRAEDYAAAALVFSATGDEGLDRKVAEEARVAGVPVNVVDRPELCDFYTPAIVNRAPLAVAVSTAGAAPVLARHVRARIETLLAPAFGDLAGLADRLRQTVTQRIATVDGRRRFWASFFSGTVAERVFAGRLAEAETEALQSLDGGPLVGHVSLVGAGPGAEDLLTLRALRVLQEADIILYDRLVPEAVVAQGRRDATRVYVGKAKGSHAVTQDEINALLVREAQAGKRVVRLKSGDPLVYGRAGEEMAALRTAGILFDVVPGITAAFAAAAETEIPLTLRRQASALVFVTGQDADGDTLPGWSSVALSGATVVVYMGRSVAARVARQLMQAGLAASTPVAVIENASRPERRASSGRLDELVLIAAGSGADEPVLFIIGDVVAEGAIADAGLRLAELVA